VVQAVGKQVTAWFLIGWGIGGIIFGALGDRYGRARMLTLTILIYSAFTGLSYFSRTQFDFTLFRFLTGVGVGGVFGLAVALIAETVPAEARAQSLGLLQVLSTVGNVAAGFAKMGIDALEKDGTIVAGTGWRWMFLIGAVPAFLIILTRSKLREPEPWLRLKAQGALPKGSILGPYLALLSQKRWRKNLLVGALRGHLVRLTLDGEKIISEERLLLGRTGRIRDVRIGPDGLVYLLTDESQGSLLRLEPVKP
jgi:MFS family permease